MELNFGENLRVLRKRKGYKQSQVAEKLNVSNSRISDYENGTGEPSIANLIKLSELFEVSIDELIRGKKTEYLNEITNQEEREAYLMFLELYKKIKS